MIGGDRGVGDAFNAVVDRLTRASATERILISILSLFASILIGGIILLYSGLMETCANPFLVVGGGRFCYNPFSVYVIMAKGAFGSAFNVATTLKQTTLLMLTGLSVALAFRAGMLNIGTQGQLVLGGMSTALVALTLGPIVPPGIAGTVIVLTIAILVGGLVGGLFAAIPGVLKAAYDANVVVTTIMLNFVAANFAFFLVRNYFNNPASGTVETRTLPEHAQLRPVLSIFEGTSFSIVVLALALALIGGGYILLNRLSYGYDLRIGGNQPPAAEYAGVRAKRVMVSSMVLSGVLAGIGGAIWVVMDVGRWQAGVPSLGFDGIAVSILAANNPLGIPLTSLLFGMLKSGSLEVQFVLGVPRELVEVIRGLIILFVAMPEFFRVLGVRYGIGGESAGPPAEGVTEGGD